MVTHDLISITRVREFEKTLQEDFDTLCLLEKQIEEAKVTDRVRRMRQLMDKYETDVNQLFEFLSSNTSPMVEQSKAESDEYVPRNTAPVNPPRLTLDYTTTNTDEGKLKAAVLEPSEHRIVALVACGKGGVGKTCALRGLADDDEIEKSFPGGTLYIQLGNNPSLADIVQGLARIVERTGGTRLAEKIRTTETLREASEKASDWFHNWTCLFLVDDIWKVNNIDSDVLDILGSMVNKSSRLVYSTRDKRLLSRAHKVIEFEDKDTFGELARRMLMRHAGFDEGDELEHKNSIAFEAILSKCQGHPLALGIAGGAVLKKSGRKLAGQKQDAWSDFHKDMVSNPQKSMLLESAAEQYGSLTRIVDVSLQVLGMNFEPGKFQKLFRALCVLQKQQFAPLAMLQKLWDLGSMNDTEHVAEALHQVSVLQLREDGGRTFVQLHDLILDIAVDKALKEFDTQSFFQTLIYNYAQSIQEQIVLTNRDVFIDKHVSRYLGKGPTERALHSQSGCSVDMELHMRSGSHPSRDQKARRNAWWKTKDDGYLHNNLCRILRGAGYKDDLLWLLSQPQWIVHRLLSAGIYNVERDLEEGKSVVAGNDLSDLDHKEHLEMVRKAARLSYTFVSNNPREVWFQLHGRLLWHATQSETTRKFVERIERCAKKPWVKASGAGFLQQASRSAAGIVRSNGEVISAFLDQEELWFFWEAYRERMGIAWYNFVTGSYKSLDFIVEESIRIDGKVPKVLCATFMRDQKKIVTVFVNGKIVVWNRVTGIAERIVECRSGSSHRKLAESRQWRLKLTKCFGICENGLTEEVNQPSSEVPIPDIWVCAVVSRDGDRIVSGWEDGTVRVWDGLKGKEVVKPLRGHSDVVGCVTVSANGHRIVSGSDDGTVRVWDAQSGEPALDPLCGHTDVVSCVTMSEDCGLILSGSLDGTIRMWNAKSGEAIGEPLSSRSDWVRCISISADGSRIVSGSAVGTVRIWDTMSGEAIGEPLRGHTDWVKCVTTSADGNRILSGSADCTVRLWDAHADAVISEPLGDRFDWVTCVTMTPNGRYIVSGSEDGVVQVWNAQSGEAVRAPFQHDSEVDRVGVDAQCSQIVSEGVDGSGKLWDSHSGECMLTSEDPSWPLTINATALSWSSFETEWTLNKRLVIARDKDGKQVVMATCEDEVANFGVGDRYWPRYMKPSCQIIW